MAEYYISAAIIISKMFTPETFLWQNGPNQMKGTSLRLFIISVIYYVASSGQQPYNVYNGALAGVLCEIVKPTRIGKDLIKTCTDVLIIVFIFVCLNYEFLVIGTAMIVIVEKIHATYPTYLMLPNEYTKEMPIYNKMIRCLAVCQVVHDGPTGLFCVALAMFLSTEREIMSGLGVLCLVIPLFAIRVAEDVLSLVSAEQLLHIIAGFLYCLWEQTLRSKTVRVRFAHQQRS